VSFLVPFVLKGRPTVNPFDLPAIAHLHLRSSLPDVFSRSHLCRLDGGVSALLNYLDRQIFAPMKKSIMEGVPDIVTEARFGELMAIFLLSVACAQSRGRIDGRPIEPPLGHRWQPRRLVRHHLAHRSCPDF
jgi:hypothetical protein